MLTVDWAALLQVGHSVSVAGDEVPPDDAELPRLQKQLDEVRRQLTEAKRDADASAGFLEQAYLGESSFAQTILQSAAVVFGLTIGFVTPNVHQLGGARLWELRIALTVLPLSMVFSLLAMMEYRLGWTRVSANRAGTPVPHPVPRGTYLRICMACFVAGVSLLGAFSVQQLVR